MDRTKPQQVYADDKIVVESLSIVGRDGAVHPRTVVRHPDVVAILPLLPDGRVVLVRNHRWPLDKTLLELPAGCMEAGEAPEVAAARELAEETGYRCSNLRPLFGFYPCPGLLDERVEVFVAEGLVPGERHLDPTEQMEVELMPLEALVDAIHAGEIEDVRTIATVLRWVTRR